MLRNKVYGGCLDLSGCKWWPVVDFCKQSNAPLISTNGEAFLINWKFSTCSFWSRTFVVGLSYIILIVEFQVSLYCFCFSLSASHWRLETASIWQDYSAMQQCWMTMCVRFSVPLCFAPCRRWWTLWTISWVSANRPYHTACFFWKFIYVELTVFRPSLYVYTYQHMPGMNNIKLPCTVL
jgi:hypothetical protein